MPTEASPVTIPSARWTVMPGGGRGSLVVGHLVVTAKTVDEIIAGPALVGLMVKGPLSLPSSVSLKASPRPSET